VYCNKLIAVDSFGFDQVFEWPDNIWSINQNNYADFCKSYGIFALYLNISQQLLWALCTDYHITVSYTNLQLYIIHILTCFFNTTIMYNVVLQYLNFKHHNTYMMFKVQICELIGLILLLQAFLGALLCSCTCKVTEMRTM